ncbi:hybrid sensor histidine kinase/response regulator [Leptospira perolatii]|uniref:histidine kinase n=1 Tax=Leptospira perolatii TaxID=2023191 RepID=A0A2M9ZKG3_9LEPT|nr:hybrid sensor histidine kinase/response regulator [Leptospira perolatii]PJZ69346.1 hybrid sensor histidine kinase/response regulator [Leptospira perolatii]PJZ72481.1 hybrid sensor histidine kinase/response regulator [Leptospira perolatii]
MKELKFLFLEDSLTDLELIQRALHKENFHYSSIHVQDRESYVRALREDKPDLILSDFSLPNFDGLSALSLARENCPGTPFIFVSGTYGEDAAIQTLKRGATDYVLKDRLVKLAPALQRAIREMEEHEARRKAEKEKFELEEQLRQSQKLEAMGLLAGAMAHEINNPLMAIIEYAKLIQNSEEKYKIDKLATRISQEGERISVAVKDLLKFSRNEKGELRKTEVRTIIEKLFSIASQRIKMNSISLYLDISNDLPDCICKEGQVIQILLNLVNNSIDALNERYPEHDDNKRIIISASVISREGTNFVKFVVEDRGAGIRPENQERVFKNFFTTKGVGTGTGLGLSVSLGIARENGGDLTFESVPMEFTKFSLTLPTDPKEIHLNHAGAA